MVQRTSCSCAPVGDGAEEDRYSIAKPLPDGSVQIDEAVSSLRGRRRAHGGDESLCLSLAERQLNNAAERLANEQAVRDEAAARRPSNPLTEQQREDKNAMAKAEASPLSKKIDQTSAPADKNTAPTLDGDLARALEH